MKKSKLKKGLKEAFQEIARLDGEVETLKTRLLKYAEIVEEPTEEIDWSFKQIFKYYKDDKYLVLSTGKYTDKEFQAIVIQEGSTNKLCDINYFGKEYFIPVNACITIKND